MTDLSGFRDLSPAARADRIAEAAGLNQGERALFSDYGCLGQDLADRMVENVIGAIPIPLGVAANMMVDGDPVMVPMATEESSVIAAVGNSAKRCLSTGGFFTSYAGSWTIAQMQIVGLSDPFAAKAKVHEAEAELLERANACDPMLVKLGGGAKRLEARVLDAPEGPMLIVHLVADTKDAMGANAVNTMAEQVGPEIGRLTGGTCLLRILSNLADQRITRARATWPADQIGGAEVVDKMVLAGRFAEIDPYRAATHNKGIMNGISAVVLATGNDTRAVEAGAHAYAARSGRYSSLTRWEKTAEGDLSGSIELPLSVGIVGGATRIHPMAQAALRIMGANGAEKLARVIAAVGLAQNFGAVRALSTVGIQQGHMRLHAQNVAITAGAEPDEIAEVVRLMVERRAIREDAAKDILAELRGG